MPGVEILANSINTILGGRFYRLVSDWTATLLAALTAIAVIFLTGIAEGKFESAKQFGALGALLALILLGSYFAFARAFIIPPIVPMLVSFTVVAPLALLRRSLAASASLDENINELLGAGKRLFTNGRGNTPPPNLDNYYAKTFDDFAPPENPTAGNFLLPRGIEWKSQTLGLLSRDLIDRALFIDSSLRSISDGLLIADTNGEIIFVNRSARRIFNLPERRLLERDIFDLLAETEIKTANPSETQDEILLRLFVDHESIEREIVIGASNADLQKMASAGEFRADLFYRLSVLTIELPPLFKRAGDVPLLANPFLRKTNGNAPTARLTQEVWDALKNYEFPGNVRELENALIRAVALSTGNMITLDCLPSAISEANKNGGENLPETESLRELFADRPTLEELQRRYLVLTLTETGGNRRKTAARLGVDRRTIQRLIARYDLFVSLDDDGEAEETSETAGASERKPV